MARTIVPLTDTKIKNAKATDKNYTLSDGQGLQLLIKTDGTKLWEFRYYSPITNNRRKTSFDLYPKVSLKSARDKRTEYQTLINSGIDPIDYYKAENSRKKKKVKKS